MTNEPRDWRVVTLPDGRVVEFVDAVLVDRDGDSYLIDVTYAIDDRTVGVQRVRIPSGEATS